VIGFWLGIDSETGEQWRNSADEEAKVPLDLAWTLP
jgi:hypothetical protein